MKTLVDVAVMIDWITRNLISDGFLVFPDKSELGLPQNYIVQEDALIQVDSQALHQLQLIAGIE
jgi:hypothetical protein